jgi:formate/nitrite transporter FocA (FNT family)
MATIHPNTKESSEVRVSATAASVYRAILLEGEMELRRTLTSLGLSGFAAGLSMGFSFLAEGFLTYYLPDAHWTPLIAKFGYAVGFVVVILGRQQLFTENTVTPVFPLFQRWSWGRAGCVARLMGIVLLGNLLGATLFAAIAYWAAPWPEEVSGTLATVAQHAIGLSAERHFFGGIFAGWIIALLVWILPFSGNGRLAVIVGLTYLIGLGGFSHVIAGSVEAVYGVLAGDFRFGEACLLFFLPTLAGNLLGGVAFVAAINHGQAGTPEEQNNETGH